ncbi:MAG TPA: hypothetical protein VFE03_06680 [Caulobacteraceae bacterium]|nr:hypothetical protein [Caulobacteraceae bacterium]
MLIGRQGVGHRQHEAHARRQLGIRLERHFVDDPLATVDADALAG